MQRHLGRFTHGTDEQADSDKGDSRHFPSDEGMAEHGKGGNQFDDGLGNTVDLRKGLGVIERTGEIDHAADAEQESEVTHPVDQEGLQVGEDGGRALVPEADEQIGHQTHRLPPEEQLQEVIAHHQHQHREGEQRDVAEETLVTRIILHVADGVDMDQQRDESHHHHHHRGQAVDHEADMRRKTSAFEEGIQVLIERQRRLIEELAQDIDGQAAAQGDQRDGGAVRTLAADLAAEQAGQGRAEQRSQCNDEQKGLGQLGGFSQHRINLSGNPVRPH